MNIPGRDKVKNFITGTYVRAFENEFYKGVDTLEIEPLSENSYRILNHGSYQRRIEKIIKHEEEVWTGIYNNKEHLLYETRYGKVISFDPKSNVLHVGSSMYQKIE
jgi:hypothetical protein